MRSDELVAGGDLAADGFGAVTRQIHQTHAGISERVFSTLHAAGGLTGGGVGLVAGPVRTLHDGIAEVAYGAVRLIGGGVLRVGARAAAPALARRTPEPISIEASPRARFVVGALNGAFGDALYERGNGMTISMSVRCALHDVSLEPGTLASAFPGATGRIAVFLHGLCETEEVWGSMYGERLRSELGVTPVYVRYNSGLHISDNGRRLDRLLSGLISAWPAEITEITLVGHSMGGLIARSACHYGAGTDAIARVRHVVSLGSPYRGSWLERRAHEARARLRRLPETRALGDALGWRSAGVRDLFHGYLVDEDWAEYDPDALVCAIGRQLPLHDTARHYFVAATLGRDSESGLSRAIGDLLVTRPSAWDQADRSERVRFPLDQYLAVGPANHFDLLSHPVIAERLVTWLSPSPDRLLCATVE